VWYEGRVPRVALGLFGLLACATFAATPMRREPALDFAVDEAFQADGGVQYFYELARKETDPARSNATLARLQALDESGRWATHGAPLHVVMSRLVYVVEQDAAFFTEARATDLGWMNAVAPDFDITRRPDGGFHADKTPANDFTIRFLGATQVAAQPPDGGLARLEALLPHAARPTSVVVQENFDFARVMGVRTGAFSVTWTAHLALAPGRTRVHVVTLSALHHLPPFFLGGERRVFDESVRGARELIERLRAAPVEPLR
jgi:hypothetical protein